jgi:hypothetical protein
MLDKGDPKGEEVFNLGLSFEALGYDLLATSAKNIQLGALEIKIDLKFVQIQIGLLENKINIAPTKYIRGIGFTAGHNGSPDFDKRLEQVVEDIKKETIHISLLEDDAKLQEQLDKDAETTTKHFRYLLLLLEPTLGVNSFEQMGFQF